MFNFLKPRERLLLPYKRELHCHIIPGVDDGSRSLEASLSYLKALASFGVKEVVFTPHCIDERYENTPAIIDPLFSELQAAAAGEHIDLGMSYSFEYRIDGGFLDLMRHGEFGAPDCAFRPLHGRYLLIENSFVHPIQEMDEVVSRLVSLGYYPILAHPERYSYYAGHNGRYYHYLKEQQLEFQCNLLSFAGYYGDVAKKMAYWMLDNGYVNFLGSDLHNDQYVQALDKFLRSKEYARIRPQLVRMIGNDHME